MESAKVRNGFLLLIFGSLLLISGCASSGRAVNVEGPKIDRISPEELARIIPPPVAKLALEDLVRLSKEGNSAELIIAQIKATDSMYDLTPSQSVDLSRQGVDAKVLDYIHESREAAVRNQLADEINRREKQKQAEVAKLKSRLWQQQRYYDPFCRGYYGLTPYGYGGYGRHFGSHFGLGLGIGRPLGCW
jgi:hypothetical protein